MFESGIFEFVIGLLMGRLAYVSRPCSICCGLLLEDESDD
jgi:hypothetical protein